VRAAKLQPSKKEHPDRISGWIPNHNPARKRLQPHNEEDVDGHFTPYLTIIPHLDDEQHISGFYACNIEMIGYNVPASRLVAPLNQS
jgi:hypothetical protein